MTTLPDAAQIRGTSESGEELFRCTWGAFCDDNADGIPADELAAIGRALAAGKSADFDAGAGGCTKVTADA